MPEIANAKITVAAPVHNEAASLNELVSRISKALDKFPGGPHEILIVNDGSTDETLSVLRALRYEENRLVVLSLSRSFGHQAALTAAMDLADGQVVILMDGDLQDPPEAIPLFMEKYREGFDVVYATRKRRKESIFLRLSYFLFYRIAGRLSSLSLPVDAGDFCLMSRRVVDEIRKSPERHRYLRGLRTWVGFPQTEIPVERAKRKHGETKYTFRRLCQLAFDGIFAFSLSPLRAAIVAGAFAMAASFGYAMYAFLLKIFVGSSPQGFTTLIIINVFLAGVQLLFLGIMGEYMGRTYEETKQRPHYVIETLIGREKV